MQRSRETILARIRSGLAVNGAMLAEQAAAFPLPHPHGPFVATDLDPVEQFRTELSALHATVHVCDGPGDALETVLELLRSAGASEVLAWEAASLPLPQLGARLAELGVHTVDGQVLGRDRQAQYAALEPAQACITGVDAAIAESGTMLVVSGPGRGRLASLLAPMHIALLPVERIRRTLPDAFDLLNDEFGAGLFRERSNLAVITGPSRTADIELSLTLGVHGPRDIHAVIIR